MTSQPTDELLSPEKLLEMCDQLIDGAKNFGKLSDAVSIARALRSRLTQARSPTLSEGPEGGPSNAEGGAVGERVSALKESAEPIWGVRRIISEGGERRLWPDPTPEMLAGDPLFDALWETIKTWDINVPAVYRGYCHATGNHVRAIYDAINGSKAVPQATPAAGTGVTQWQPISKAPKDGTEIILRRGGRVTSGAYETWPTRDIGGVIEEGGEAWSSWDGGFTEDEPPTHWQPMPLPPSPAQPVKGEG